MARHTDGPRRKLNKAKLAVLLTLAAAVAAGVLYVGRLVAPAVVTAVTGHAAPQDQTFLLLGERGNLAYTPYGSGGSSLTDSLIVVHLDPQNHRIVMLSVPRDSRVHLPGHGWTKLNTANAFGGPQLALATVNKLLGSHIKDYVLVNFTGFVSVVNTLGCVNVDIKSPMHYSGGPNTRINLPAGTHCLNGQQSLEFVRYREFPLGDIQRTLDQQAFLLDLSHTILRPSTLLHLPTLIPQLDRAVQTNVPQDRLLAMAVEARQLEHNRIIHETLPGAFLNLPDASYWEVVPADAHRAWQDLLQGKTLPLMDPGAEAAARALGGTTSLNTAPPTTTVTQKVYGKKPATGKTKTGGTSIAVRQMAPVQGPPGTTLTLLGSFPAQAGNVVFSPANGSSGALTDAPVKSWNTAAVTATVPNLPPGAYIVLVETPGAPPSDAHAFSVTGSTGPGNPAGSG